MPSHFSRSLAISLVLCLLLFACKKSETSGDTALSSVTEAAVASIAGTIDEQTAASFAYRRPENRVDSIKRYLTWPLSVEESWAAGTCAGRAVGSSCSSSKRAITYDCTFGPNDSYQLKGDVTLTYSQPTCSFGVDGDIVTRTLDITRTGLYAGTLQVSSTLHSNYEGTAIGGGSQLVQVDGVAKNWTLNILGQKRVVTGPNNFVFYHVSMKTPGSPHIAISGGLSRASRVIDVGSTVQVFHNVSKFTSTFTVSQALTHDSTCCYPTGGKIDFVNTGSRTDTGVVSFSACGRGTITAGTATTDFEFATCE